MSGTGKSRHSGASTWISIRFAQNQSLLLSGECPVYPGDLNRSMQHLDSKYREEDVADEVQNEDLLQRRAEIVDVGSLAGRRFFARDCSTF